jgi:predicted nucleic acid-binding protein
MGRHFGRSVHAQAEHVEMFFCPPSFPDILQHRHRAGDDLEKIVQLVSDRQSRRERLAIKVGERFLLVQAEEIVYASLADDSITVVTGQHAGTSNYRTLDELLAIVDGIKTETVMVRTTRNHPLRNP